MIGIATASADSFVVTVAGSANPYLAGWPAGTTAYDGDSAPAESPVLVPGTLPASGSAITFTNVTGSVNYEGLTPTDPPDGNTAMFQQHLNQPLGSSPNPENGIADLIAPLDSLVGVFLGPGQPDPSQTPIGLDFSPGGLGGTAFTTIGTLDFASLSPLLQQPFFIGDGLANGTTVQTFIVPAGATRLYLGSMDGYQWNNNTGSFSVQVNLAPEPSTLALLAVGAVGLVVGALRRGAKS